MNGIALAKGDMIFKNHRDIVEVDNKIRENAPLELILHLANYWYEKEVKIIKRESQVKRSFQISFMYSKVGNACGGIVDLIKWKRPNNKKYLLEWLLKRSNVEDLAGEHIANGDYGGHMSHQFKCYGFSADCDKEIGFIYKARNDLTSSLRYLENAGRKYKYSLIIAKRLVEGNFNGFNIEKTKKYIAYTHNHIANIYTNLFFMTHDFGYLMLAKEYNVLSEKHFEGIIPNDLEHTRKNIQEGFRILKSDFELD